MQLRWIFWISLTTSIGFLAPGFAQSPPPRPLLRPDRQSPSRGILTHIPSQAGGREGIAVRVLAPEKPRYAEGAPIAIHVAGGFQAGAAAGRPFLLPFGFVEVFFAFPGGGNQEARSGGKYDFRGPNSIRALADVIRFATGRLRDRQGRTIQELVAPLHVLTNDCGLLGMSQGGNACGVVMAKYGQEFPDLAFYVSMESPYGEGIANVELGGRRDGRINPAYDPQTGRLDLSKLAFDPELNPAPALLGRTPSRLRGAFYFDMNGNGRFDPEVDFPVHAVIGDAGTGMKIWYSPRVLREAERRHLLGPKRPAHIPSLQEAIAFWEWRDAAPSIPQAVRNCPKLAVIVYANEQDHVQIAPDHPHILIQVEGFRKAGARFVRLNPDRAYVLYVLPKDRPLPESLRKRIPDNDAGIVWTRDRIRKGLEPRELPMIVSMQAASCELADRVYKNVWKPNLDRVLCDFTPLPFPLPPLQRPGPPPPGFQAPGRPRLGQPPAGPLPWRRRPSADVQTRPSRSQPVKVPKVRTIQVDAAQTIGQIRSLLGVNRGPYDWSRRPGDPLVSLVQSYHRFGIDFIRTHDFYGPTDWYVIFPDWKADPEDPKAYDFGSSDARICAIVTNGFRCYFRLGTSWKGRNPKPINDPPGTIRDSQGGQILHRADRNDFRKWAQICVHIARHYTAGWNHGFHFPIQYWEVWNEPDLAVQFWTGSPQQYYMMYEEVARALKAFNPQFQVGGPACTGGMPRAYVEDFIRYCAEHHVSLDFFSWHSYGGRGVFNPYNYRRDAERIRRALDRYGFHQTTIILSEWNAGIRDRLFSDSAAGAAFYASVLANLLDAGVAYAFQYCGDSHPGLGLHRVRTHEPKRCAYAFLAWKQLLQTPVRISATGSNRSGFNVVAGKRADGKRVQILLSDFWKSSEPGPQVTYRLQIRHLPWAKTTRVRVRRYLLDGQHLLEPVQEQILQGQSLQLEYRLSIPQVTLLVLEPIKGP